MNILFAATPKIALKTLEIIYESKHDLVGVICAQITPTKSCLDS